MKKEKENENEIKGLKERLNSVRNVKDQREHQLKSFKDEDILALKEKCSQLELDNRELTKHLKILLESHSDNEHIELYKHKIHILESKVTALN